MYYYVYVLENQQDKSLYIGFTRDLVRRVKEHNEGRGGRTTALKKDWKCIYFEGYICEKDAIGREKFLKGGSGRKYLDKQLTHYYCLD